MLKEGILLASLFGILVSFSPYPTKLLKESQPMEEAVYKELKALCSKIIEQGNDLQPNLYLTDLREIEEKLILLDYLQYRKNSLTQKTSAPVQDLDTELLETLKQASIQKAEIPSTPKSEESTAETEIEPEDIVAPKEVVPEMHFEEDTAEQIPGSNKSGKQISLGLNDRLAFTKHLFAGSQQDLNRVISQLNTLSSYKEAEKFITDMVKPDYDWSSHEEYEERLFELIKAGFGED